MRKERIAIPKPRSSFLSVQCSNCGNEQTIFSMSTIEIKCKVCDSVIATPTGGRAQINATILRRLD